MYQTERFTGAIGNFDGLKGWNNERVDLLKKLWTQGLSASQIAVRLGGGVSRNAVIGKVHRLGLEKRADPRLRLTPTRSHELRKARRKAEAKPKLHVRSDNRPYAPTFAATPLPPEPSRPRKLFKLIDLEDLQCRYVFGDPRGSEPWGFCGCRTAPGSSYCMGHHAKVYTPAPEKRHGRAVPNWRGKHALDRFGGLYRGKEAAV